MGSLHALLRTVAIEPLLTLVPEADDHKLSVSPNDTRYKVGVDHPNCKHVSDQPSQPDLSNQALAVVPTTASADTQPWPRLIAPDAACAVVPLVGIDTPLPAS